MERPGDIYTYVDLATIFYLFFNNFFILFSLQILMSSLLI